MCTFLCQIKHYVDTVDSNLAYTRVYTSPNRTLHPNVLSQTYKRTTKNFLRCTTILPLCI